MLDFKEECEMYYWYGQKTYDSNGVTSMKDENGQPIDLEIQKILKNYKLF